MQRYFFFFVLDKKYLFNLIARHLYFNKSVHSQFYNSLFCVIVLFTKLLLKFLTKLYQLFFYLIVFLICHALLIQSYKSRCYTMV